MPFIQTEGARLYWRCDGSDDRPALLLGNSIGTDHCLWDPVMPELTRSFRVLRFDMRGHGASEASSAPEYALDRLARDALAVADAAGAKRFHFAGISLGGMIGMWLGVHAPERLERLVLSNTAPHFPPEGWADRIAAVRAGGMASIADMAMGRFFTPAFVQGGGPLYGTARRTLLNVDPAGYIGCCAAIRDMDLRGDLATIAVPTLVIAGKHDLATPPAQGHAIAAAILGAAFKELACAHIPTLEAPAAFVDAVLGFLSAQADGSEKQRYDRGLARRKEVLGVEYVEARLRSRHSFTDEFQALITRYAWGEMWTRPVFDDRTRRLLVLAMMVALKSWEEFELHVRAGLEHELSETELKEMLMLAAVYCGVPAANSAFGHAKKIIGP
ncbi:MAG: 3-oxoadipate enol-lactonase [Candidatus Parcubacteria bacterium]|nr:3-oxoadipate enol-lactonase [Burkholderiales bacterium]